jgi:hypothetical protein
MIAENLPYIYISEINAKILIDTGSTKSLLSPEIVQKFYPNQSFNETFKIQTPHMTSYHNQTICIPSFEIFNVNEIHKFYVFNFSDKYDGLIGMDLLTQLHVILDFNENLVYTPNAIIPLTYQSDVENHIDLGTQDNNPNNNFYILNNLNIDINQSEKVQIKTNSDTTPLKTGKGYNHSHIKPKTIKKGKLKSITKKLTKTPKNTKIFIKTCGHETKTQKVKFIFNIQKSHFTNTITKNKKRIKPKVKTKIDPTKIIKRIKPKVKIKFFNQ